VATAVLSAVAGASLARAAMGAAERKRTAAELGHLANEVITDLGVDRDLMSLTDTAYHRGFPACPRTLDPGDPSHADCIRLWLQLRDEIAARLPAPRISSPEPAEGLADTGPAAEMRGWLQSLTAEQRNGLRRIIGANHYDPIVEAAQNGDDEGTVKAVRRLRKDADDLAANEPLAAWRQYSELKSLLGSKLDDFLKLTQRYAA